MAKLDTVFNAADVPEREEFLPVPPGSYTAMIVASELKDTSKGGQMIVLEFELQEGEHSGRKLFERLNIKNDNPKAVDIAFRTLGEIVKAAGRTTIKDTDELHGRRMYIEVRVEPARPYTKDGVEHPGTPQNSIKKFLPVSGAGATPKTVESQSSGAVAPDNKAVPPWKRKTGA